MSNQSVANNPSGQQLSNVPAIHSFEFDKQAIGNVKSSVNKFRGSISLPIDFLTLPGREGLDVKLSAIYSSSVTNNVRTWNLDKPTGILGLGWEMPLERISVFKSGSNSATSDSFFLLSNGVANPMVKTGEIGGSWTFQLRNYEFWSISYNPATMVWTIVKENGFVFSYGGNARDAIQWGVNWGNWIGASAERSGQQQYPVAWNLASIESPYGHRVEYSFLNVNQKVGENGHEFTQASYIKRVTDSYERTLSFNYGEKFGARNPKSGMLEYQAQNAEQREPNAYQNKYETKYLESVDVANAAGETLHRLNFTYRLINLGNQGTATYPLLWKRCLTSVYQNNPDGSALPGMQFEYFQSSSDTNPGALKSAVYPTGGKATFAYKEQLINSPKREKIDNPMPGSTPGVWQGPDYVVFTYCRPTGGIKVLVYSWAGRWVKQEITSGAMQNVKTDPTSLVVTTQSDYIALSYRNVASKQDELYLFRKDNTKFGDWSLANNGNPYLLRLKNADAGASSFVAGTDFVVAYNQDYSAKAFQVFSYDWRKRLWTTPQKLPPVISGTDVVVAAFQNYYVIAYYSDRDRRVTFEIFYRDLDGTWKSSQQWSNSKMEIVQTDGKLLLTLNPQPTCVVMTYVSKSTNVQIDYSLRIFQWDENFTVRNASNPTVANLTTPVSETHPQYQIFQTIAIDSLVTNNPDNMRYTGTTRWLDQSFKPKSTSNVSFTSGKDVAVMCEDDNGRQNNLLLVFNPNNNSWSFKNDITNKGSHATLNSIYLTVGQNIYVRQVDGSWRKQQTELNNLMDEASVQNLGPNYIAYQNKDDSTAKSYLVMLKNGEPAPPKPLGQSGEQQKIYVPKEDANEIGLGIRLAGPRFLVSYPSSKSLKDATSFSLFNLDEGDQGANSFDFPVACVEIEDACHPELSYCQSFFYANSAQSMIAYDAINAVAQYPVVTVVPGVKSMQANPPVEQPKGRSEFYYSNGISPQKLNYHVQGWLYNYQHILNGMLLSQQDYDSRNKLVSSQLNYWQFHDTDVNLSQFLYGAYVRLMRTTTVTDGVTSDSTTEFDKTTGVQLWQELNFFDANGVAKTLREENRYAYQEDYYKAAFLKQHIYTAVVQTTKSVMAEGQDRNYIQSKATTYRNWARTTPSVECDPSQSPCRFARWQVYQWTRPGTTAPHFSFDPSQASPDAGDWVLSSEIIRRTNPVGLIEEQQGINGVRSSFVFDKDQRYLVAKFPNGSLQRNEINYYGFENYEVMRNWVLGGGAAIAPNQQNPEVDAHSGTRSLRLGPSTTGSDGIVGTFRPDRFDQPYVFSAWVKKPQGFANNEGNASWKISVQGAQDLLLEFPATIDTWVYVSQVIELNASSVVEITITGENANASKSVMIDNLRFSPMACLFEGSGYDTRFWLPNAALGANGESSRTFYDEFETPVMFTNAADQASKITKSYFSRQGNQGVFSTTDPNHTLKIQPSLSGSVCSFTRGSQWRQYWNSRTGDWKVVGKRLTQSSNALGTLSVADPNFSNDYAVAVNFETTAANTSPLGLRLPNALSVQLDPKTFEWHLLNSSGSPLANDVARPLFKIPVDPYASQLAALEVSAELAGLFDASCYPLPVGSKVSPGAAAQGPWVVEGPDNRYRYHLIHLNATSIGVFQVPNNWIAIVASRQFVFWANGRLIFSFHADSDFNTGPELFFGNQVAISELFTAIGAQASVSFDDARGINIQGQILADNSTVVSQTITDNMGRQAVRTKAAFVLAATNPVFAYCPNYASLDWSTGKMTGLVSDAFPGDHNYPYSRSVHETSPLARMVEQGLPGQLFCIGAHTTKIAYGATGLSLNSNPQMFFKVTTTNANGDVYYQASNQLEQVVAKVSIKGSSEIKNVTVFDDAGNAVELRSPNYYDPPFGSNPDNWANVRTFDYAGRQLTGDTGGVHIRYIYDKAGNLRFMQDSQGASEGNFNYVKFDSTSRPVEKGYIDGTWNEQQLQALADTDAEWPPTPPTWRKIYFFDGNQQIKNAIGRVYQVLVNNKDDGKTDVTEMYRYDVMGNTTSHCLNVVEYDASQEHFVDYGYDNIGNITQIQYPVIDGGDRLTVYYRRNKVNQVTAIAEVPDFSSMLATFSYQADGRPLDEKLDLGGGQQFDISLGYNSPLWLNSIQVKNSLGNTLFGESLSYTEGGFSNSVGGYFDGTIAAAAYEFSSGSSEPYECKYSYDALGQVENSEVKQHDDWNLGVTESVTYDSNGNFQCLPHGGVARRYQYTNGSQRVEKVTDGSDGRTLASYEYDGNGNATKCNVLQLGISNAHDLTIDYDPGTNATTHVANAANGDIVSFRYGGSNERVLKQVQNGANEEKKLYIRGVSAYPLCELTAGKAKSTSFYVIGPRGIVQMRRNGTNYGILKDHLGSSRVVLDPAGRVVATYDYLTYGALSAVNEPEPGFLSYLYTGQEYDRELGLFNYRARFYAADLGRFIATDPDQQFFSPYIYAANNPVLYIDPTGRFSVGSFFSAIGGALIGAVEILIGVVIDVVAVVAEVVTGGLSTPASIALAALAGTFYGAGISAISYSVFHFDDFSWKDYGIQMGIGALAGAITFGFGQAAAIAAESATGAKAAVEAGLAVSKSVKAANYAIEGGVSTVGAIAAGTVAGSLNDVAQGITPGADLAEGILWSTLSSVSGKVIPTPDYKAGWGQFGKRLLAEIGKEESVGVSVNILKNASHGRAWDNGLAETIGEGVISGATGALAAKDATKDALEDPFGFG